MWSQIKHIAPSRGKSPACTYQPRRLCGSAAKSPLIFGVAWGPMGKFYGIPYATHWAALGASAVGTAELLRPKDSCGPIKTGRYQRRRRGTLRGLRARNAQSNIEELPLEPRETSWRAVGKVRSYPRLQQHLQRHVPGLRNDAGSMAESDLCTSILLHTAHCTVYLYPV